MKTLEILKPMDIVQQVSGKIGHYVPRDVARTKRLHAYEYFCFTHLGLFADEVLQGT